MFRTSPRRPRRLVPSLGNSTLPRRTRWLTVIVVSWAAAAASSWSAEPPRTWTDSTGVHTIEAALLRVEGNVAQLRRADGRTVEVPFERLSEADQKYLKSLSNPFDVAAAGDPAARQAAVAVWCLAGNRSYACSGLVLKRDAKLAYVLGVTSGIATDALGKGSRFFVEVFGAGDSQRVPARRVAFSPQTSRLVLTIPAEAVPAAAKAEQVALAEDQPVRIAGCEIQTAAGSAVARVWTSGKVSRIFRNAAGEVEHFEVSAPDALQVRGGLVLTEQGQVAGVTEYTGVDGRRSRTATGLGVLPARHLDELQQAVVEGVAIVPLQAESDPAECEFVVFVTDPFGQIKEPRLHVQPADLTLAGQPARGLVLKDAAALPLVARAPSEAALPWLTNRPPEGTTLVAKHKTSLRPDATLRQPAFSVQFEYQDARRQPVFTPVSVATLGRPVIPGTAIAGSGMPPGPAPRKPHPQGGLLATDASTRMQPEQSRDAEWKEAQAPRAQAASEDLAGPEYLLSGTPAQAIQVDVSSLVYDAEWSDDGQRLFLLQRNGLLRQIEVPGFHQTLSLNLPGECSSLTRCRAGLVAVLNAMQRVVLIDERTLAVKASLILPSAREAKASPQLPLSYVLGQGVLYVVDWEKPAALHRVALPGHRSSRLLAVTPDGKYLFLADAAITRFRIDGPDLIEEQSSPMIGSNSTSLCVSADSQLVGLPAGGGNSPAPGFPAVGYGTYLFAVGDLLTPKLAITTGAYPITLGFDPRSGEIYAQNHESLLLVFNRGGAQQKAVAHRGTGTAQRFFVHPGGGRLLVKTEQALLWLRVKAAEGDAAAASPATASRKPAGATAAGATAAGAASAATGTDHREWLAKSAPQPTATGETLSPHAREVGGVQVTDLTLAGQLLAGAPIWSRDGSFFVTVDKSGLVRKFQARDFQETQRLELNTACSDVALAKSGVVIAAREWQAVIGLELPSLRVQTRLDVPVPQQLAAAPANDLMFVQSGNGPTATLSLVDLAGPAIVKQYTPMSLTDELRRLTPGQTGLPHTDFQKLAVTPDGRWLFLYDMTRICRFRLAGQSLLFDESTPVLCDNSGRFAVSPDSLLIALPSGSGNRLVGSPQSVKPYTTIIFAVNNLQEPQTSIASGPYPRILAFDPKNKRIFAQNHESQLLVFSDRGEQLKALTLADRREDPLWFAPHPEGHGLLVCGPQQTWWVSLPVAAGK